MRERLREVAELAGALPGRTPRPAGRRRCAGRAAARRSPRPRRARPMQRAGCPRARRCRQERSLARRQAVDARRLLGARSGRRSRRASARARSPRRCRRMRGSSAGRKPTSGIISRLASSSLRSVGLRRTSLELGVEAALADLARGSRRGPAASARPGRRSPKCSTASTRAVEGDPGHHLRVREVPPRPAHLPDPLVRLASRRRSRNRSSCRSQRPRVGRLLEPVARRAWCSASITSP